VFSFVLAGLLGYLLGSFPTAFLLVRWKSHLDIRSAGSGNVGTLNSYQVSGSYAVGGAVLALDALKGVGAVALSRLVPGHDFPIEATAGVFAILGHNFPVWLRFKGGRGLATAAGVFSMFCWPLVIVWGILWCGGYLLMREVNPANAAASFLIPLIIGAAPEEIFSRVVPDRIGHTEFTVFAAVAILLVLVKHLEPVRAYIKERQQ
jgi:acyl phosphate:glycerol-3-phosphate acyltransferase